MMKVGGSGRSTGPSGRGWVRVVVPGPRGPEPGADRGVPGPAGPADERRGTRRGGRAGPVDRVAALEGPRRRAVRPRRRGRHRPALPDQQQLHRVLSVRRRRRDGPARARRDRRLRVNAVTVRQMEAADAKALLAVYQAGLDGGNASFEDIAPD